MLGTQVKPRQGTLAESEVSHLTLGLGNFMLVRAHVIVGSTEDQTEVHTPSRGDQGEPLDPAPGTHCMGTGRGGKVTLPECRH